MNVDDAVARTQRRTVANYGQTDRVGSFCFETVAAVDPPRVVEEEEEGERGEREEEGEDDQEEGERRQEDEHDEETDDETERGTRRADDRDFRPSSRGNPFAVAVRSSVVRCLAVERRARLDRRTSTVSEYVECLFDKARGPTAARTTFDRSSRSTADDGQTETEHRGMALFADAVRGMRVLLETDGRFLEPFQWEYLQCFLLNFFASLVGSDTNRFLHRALTLLSLGSAAVGAYDPAFPDETVASEMASIFDRVAKRMVVLVAPRRSGKSVAVDLAIALMMAFSSKNAYLLLAAHVFKAAALHLDPVKQHLETLKEAGLLPRTAKISKNEREVTLVIPAGGRGGRVAGNDNVRVAVAASDKTRKSTFHVLSGAPNVSRRVTRMRAIG